MDRQTLYIIAVRTSRVGILYLDPTLCHDSRIRHSVSRCPVTTDGSETHCANGAVPGHVETPALTTYRRRGARRTHSRTLAGRHSRMLKRTHA